MKSLLTQESIIAEMKATLPDYSGSDFETWFNDNFNVYPYIIGTKKANDNLMHYQGTELDGPLGAIIDSAKYLKSLGIDYTYDEKLTDPEKLVSTLVYCMTDCIFHKAVCHSNITSTTINQQTINELSKSLDNLKPNTFQYEIHF